jgi:hypothetical protein
MIIATRGGWREPMRIPAEIHRFFDIGEGQTLLIKGLPGTGKTTLAFEILNEMCEKRKGIL